MTTPSRNEPADRLRERIRSNNWEIIEQEFDAALRAERLRYVKALIWMSGSDDFSPSGKAYEGFVKIVRPLLDEVAGKQEGADTIFSMAEARRWLTSEEAE